MAQTKLKPKRALAWLLALCMAFGMLPMTAFSEEADSSVITSFEPLDELTVNQYWGIGTDISELNLPSILSSTVTVTSGAAIIVTPAEEIAVLEWLPAPAYDSETAGIYIFTPTLDLLENYSLADGVELPKITVEINSTRAANITFIFDEDENGYTALYLKPETAYTEADLLRGISAADETGKAVTVTVKDMDGLAPANPVRPEGAFPQPYVIKYAATHPVTGNEFTATREVYVTVGIQAAAGEVADAAGLRTAASASGTGDIVLGGDISITNAVNYVNELQDKRDAAILIKRSLTLDLNGHSLSIDLSNYVNKIYSCGIKIMDGLTLTIKDSSIAKSGTLTIVIGNTSPSGNIFNGAAIDSADGSVIIESGTFHLTGGSHGAGIGGGNGNNGGNITINGGVVNARGGTNAAGIGGSNTATNTNINPASCGNITINGGVINATGGSTGAGIGTGSNAGGGSITITGGIVIANGGAYGAGIGEGGQGVSGVAINISGGIVNAKGGSSAKDIGTGAFRSGSPGTTTITNSSVFAANRSANGFSLYPVKVTVQNAGVKLDGADVSSSTCNYSVKTGQNLDSTFQAAILDQGVAWLWLPLGATTITAVSAAKTKTENFTVGTGPNDITIDFLTILNAANVNINAPVAGATPDTLAQIEAATNGTGYTVTNVVWNQTLTTGGKFAAGTVYTATITLTAKEGYKFQSVAFTPTSSSGAPGNTTTNGGDVEGNNVTFTVAYTTTAAKSATDIVVKTQPNNLTYTAGEALDLTGLAATVTYNDGTTADVGYADFSTHSPDVITMTYTGGGAAAQGDTMSVDTHNSKTITLACNGNTDATNALTVNRFITTLTAANVIITAPSAGATPDTLAQIETATNGTGYTVTNVVWNQTLTTGGKFAAGTVYTATITLTAKAGYKFQSAAFTPTSSSGTPGNTTTNGGDVEGNNVTFTVAFATTAAKSATDIVVKTQPNNLTYTAGEALDLTGLAATVTYNDGTTADVGYADFGTHSPDVITMTYTGGGAAAQGDTMSVDMHNSKTITLTCNGNTDATNALTVTTTPVVATPVFSPITGTHKGEQSVVITSATSGATIYYIMKGITAVYNTPVQVPVSVTITAYAVKDGMINSGIAVAEYIITYDVPGTVDDQTGTGGAVTVKLMQGSQEIRVTSTTDGNFTFTDVPSGIYNLVVTKGGTTTTTKITVDNNYTSTAIILNGKKDTIVEVKNDNITPDVVVDKLPEVLANLVANTVSDETTGITQAEVDKAESGGGKLALVLTVEGLTESNAPNASDIIAEAGENQTIEQYIDLSVYKRLWDTAPNDTTTLPDIETQLTVLPETVVIYIPLCAALQGKDFYFVYRYHGMSVDTIPEGETNKTVTGGEYFERSEDGAMIILHVKKFSTYAIGYSTILTNAQTPTIDVEPQDRTISVAGDVTLSVSASVTDGGTLSYQWYYSNGAIIPGATGSSYSTSADSVGSASYYVVVTNTNNRATGNKIATATSRTATITVNNTVFTSSIIIASAGSGGTILPSGEVSVINGTNQTFTITTNHNYYISNVIVDGVNLGAVSTYTFNNVTTSHTISVTFSYNGGGNTGDDTGINYVTVKFNGNGGSGSKSPVTLAEESSYILPGNPFNYSGYTFNGWKVNNSGKTLNTETSITVNADITLYAQWTANDAIGDNNLIITPPIDGSVTAKLSNPVKDDIVTISVNPDDGYTLDTLTIKDENENLIPYTDNGDGRYTFRMPNGKVTVKATFKKLPVVDDSDVSGLLNSTDHFAYVSGRGNDIFAPDENMTRAEAAQMFYNLLRNKNVPITKSFPDVLADAWYATAVKTLASLGIVNGYPDGGFHPEDNITRAQFATIVVQFAKLSTGDTRFTDVPMTHWAYDYINTAVNFGWVTGVGDGKFAPDRNITRAEAVTLINRMLKRYPDKDYIDNHFDLIHFADIDKKHWAYYEIMEAANTHDYKKDDDEEIWR